MEKTESRQERYERGRARRLELLGPDVAEHVKYLEDLAPDLERIVMENLFGDIFLRPGLDAKTRSLCTICVLASQGRETQTRAHIRGALNVGAKKEEIVEALIQLLFYAGLPAASTGLKIASEVFKERGL
jgi:4-carboxymuconolactone decarboxylase